MRLNLVICLAAAGLVLSCTKPPVKGASKVLVPWPTDHGTYELQVIDVATLRDTSAVSGDVARIYMEPDLTEDGLRGAPPSAHFITTDEGVLVPTDFMSAQLAGLYAHAEKLWDLDRELGLDALISYPRKYGLKAKVYRDGGSELVKNNATYVSQGDSTLIMPYEGNPDAPDKQLPIPLNAGIIAHEHFHALFDAIMGKTIRMPGESSLDSLHGCDVFSLAESEIAKNSEIQIPQLQSKIKTLQYNLLVMRGINEGLADIWGWVYTGDDSFIMHSMPAVGKRRVLQTSTNEMSLTTKKFSERATQLSDKARLSLSYELGTQIARAIRIQGIKLLIASGVSSKPTLESRQERLALASIIIKSLPALKELFQTNLDADTPIETTAFNDVLFNINSKVKLGSEDCGEVLKLLSEDSATIFEEKNCAK